MEQRNHVWDIQITLASEPYPSWDDPLLTSATKSAGTEGLLDLLRDFKSHCPGVVTLHVNHAAGDVFDYVITHEDTRVWRQQLRRADPIPQAAMTFDVPEFWAIHEIAGVRGSIVRKVIELLNTYDITSIEVEWL